MSVFEHLCPFSIGVYILITEGVQCKLNESSKILSSAVKVTMPPPAAPAQCVLFLFPQLHDQFILIK